MPGAHTGLSPEWDRRPDDAFAELVCHDEDLVRAEFDRLTRSAWPGSYRTAPATGSPNPSPRQRPGRTLL
jgi:hypothetical protein